MTFVDYYKTLGIEKNATPKDIKSAYRKLARKYHPDLHPNNPDANRNFQQINEANEVLSDPVKRQKYDQYGKDWQHAEESAKANPYQNPSSNDNWNRFSGSQAQGDFSDFFESMFGGASGAARGRQMKYRGDDYQTEISLDLVDALKTHKQTLTVNGKNIRITIPAGIENEQTIKISGHGGPGINNGPNGDLYISFKVANHNSNIQRLGNDLYTTIELDLYTAILGGEITIETLTGKVKLKVAPETQNGTKIKLRGKGFPVYKKEEHFGDLYVTYSVKVPTNLTTKQKNLFTELSQMQV